MKRYLLYIPIMLAMVMVACSDNSDDYQPGEMVKAGCQQVHFAAENATTIIRDINDDNARQVDLVVARNTTEGSLTVPVKTGSSTSEGITVQESVTFSDGDSLATLVVTMPDSVSTGQTYKYSLTLTGDEVDYYSALGGGCTFAGQVSYPNTVAIDFWVDGQLAKWKESALDMGCGKYLISNFMHSGVGAVLSVGSDGSVDLSPQDQGKLYSEESSYGTLIYWYDNYTGNYINLYPYGPGGSTVVTYFVLLNSSIYSKYDAQSKYGYFYLCDFQTQDMTDPVEWVYMCFQIE